MTLQGDIVISVVGIIAFVGSTYSCFVYSKKRYFSATVTPEFNYI